MSMASADLPPGPDPDLTGEPRWQRLRRLFSAVDGLAAAERTAFMDRELADEPVLRGELEELLQADAGAGDFLMEPTGGGAARMIGPYRLLEVLGEGGFGVVYLAQQLEPISRRVALKLIRPGMDTRRVIARFEAERQVLASLDHPGIARVLDAGETADGRPYFAMEYVQGVPITVYGVRADLDLRARLLLFLQVCDAVQHAHQAGVIHRDLKASNVLVTEQSGTPCPRVIDFGIAKATGPGTEENTATIAGTVLGTLGAMSPEQAGAISAKVDIRSDVYSLGVLLFELLTGVPPFDPVRLRGLTWLDALCVIRSEDPPPLAARAAADLPPTWRRKLDGELGWITARAMAKEPDGRYATVSEFAADIRRHLADEPVFAAAPGTAYRARKFVRRHRAAVGAAAVVTLALLVGLTVSTWGLVRARRAEATAAREAAVAAAVNRFLNDDLLASVAPSARRGRGRDVLMREVLDTAAERIDAAAAPGGPLADEPAVETSIRVSLGQTYLALGEYATAEPHLLRALELQEAEPEDTALAARLANLGQLHQRSGDYAEAEDFLTRAIAVRRRVAPTDTVMIHSTEFELATVYRHTGRLREAEAIYLPMLEYLQRRLGPDADRTLSCQINLASLYQETGRLAAAESLQTLVLAASRRVEGDEAPATLFAMNNLANTMSSRGEIDAARMLMEQTLALKRRVFGPEHPSTLNSLAGLAELHTSAGAFADAAGFFREAIDLRTRVLGPAHPTTLEAQVGLALALALQGPTAETRALAEAAHASCDSILGEHDEVTLWALLVRVMAEQAAGSADPAWSEATLRGIIAAADPGDASDSFLAALGRTRLAQLLAGQGRCAEASALLRRALPALPVWEAPARLAAHDAAAAFEPCRAAAADTVLGPLAAELAALAADR